MPELCGKDRDRFTDALAAGARFGGYVNYTAKGRMGFSEHLGSYDQQHVTCVLHQYAVAGGKIIRDEEERSDRSARFRQGFHLWPEVDGRGFYFEARFDFDEDSGDFEVQIVHVHSL